MDLVDVRTVADDQSGPMAFLWLGRLYVVREVLGRWTEGETDVWRVNASTGRAFGDAVYDLHRSPMGVWELDLYPHAVTTAANPFGASGSTPRRIGLHPEGLDEH